MREGKSEGALCVFEGSGLNWGFPKIRGTLFWGPDNKDPTS